MNLSEIRTKAVQLSGRYDLVQDAVSYVDNGMNFHINAGQKYLDKLVNTPENTAQIFESLGVNEYSLTFQHHCRNIKTVFINSSQTRSELTKVDLNDLKIIYNEPANTTDTGPPLYYALANLRALETTAKTSLGTFINLTWAETDTKYDYRGIIIVPPADTSYVVEVTGKFMQKILTNDADENYWSLEYPHLLLMATLRNIEVFNRNTEGINDWARAIQNETTMLEFDVAEEESYGITQFEG